MENIRKRIKAKSYPLNWKILNLLKVFNTVTLEGFVRAMKGEYSEHTIKKALPKLERGEGEKDENGEKEILIYSTRDMNKNKVYRLTEKGIAYLNNLDIKSGGYEQVDYDRWLIFWSSDVGGNKINLSTAKGVDAVKRNSNDETVALIIEKEGEAVKELKERVKQAMINGYITQVVTVPFVKIYVVTFYPEREREILSLNDTEPKISCTKIELF